MKTDKIELTIPNKLYGDKTVTAYAAKGLAVAKVGKTWTIYHIAEGATVNGRYQVGTRREAMEKMQRLLLLTRRTMLGDVWELPFSHPRLRRLFADHRDEIRAILS